MEEILTERPKHREVIEGLETILARTEQGVMLEKKELAFIEDAIIYIKKYVVLQGRLEEIERKAENYRGL